ncbi:MAG: hypothetical protein H6907_06365 [Hyphomicrobiales bacterium]|nr:hypothetical protein [Hyphomicrobiales bacterium]
MTFARISVCTAMERNRALSEAREAITGSGGWIVDHKLFSNAMATLNFEVPAGKAETLVARLEQAGLQPETGADFPPGGTGDLRGQITLTFIHREPDLKREVPAFG